MAAKHGPTQADHGERMIRHPSELSVGMEVILHQSNGPVEVEIVATYIVTLGYAGFRYRLPSGKTYSKTYADAGMEVYNPPLHGWNQDYWVERAKTNSYRIYGRTIEPGVTESGGQLEWHHGCNGETHASCLSEVFCNSTGDVELARYLATVKQGPCDKTCGSAGGGFLFTSVDKPHPLR